MKIKILFEDIKDAIESASFEHHYLIDKDKNEIVFISEYEGDYEKKLEEVENNNFIGIPERMPDDDFHIMKSFIGEIKDFKIAQKFDEAFKRKKPFRNFMALIDENLELRDRWFEHRDKEITNDTANWLCMNNIELEDKSFIPRIKINEVKKEEVNFPEEWEDFGPVACMSCNNKESFKTRYFELNVSNENMFIDNEIKTIMKKDFKVEHYGHLGGGEKEILTSSECSKCKSKEIFEDF